MKAFLVLNFSRHVCAAVVAGMGLGAVSCSLPPREAWQRMRQDGVLKAFFVPKRMGVMDDRTQRLAGADLSVEEGASGSRAGAPVAVAADQPGYVWSPRTATRKLVNVKDFTAGETVLCPYTLEPFVVPGVVAVAAEAGLAGRETFGPATPLPVSAPPVRTPSKSLPDPTLVAANPAVEEVTPEEADVAGADPLLLPPISAAPFGSWVEGKPGHVYSPFAARHQLVDVGGLPLGAEVHCPYSRRIFRVPASADLVGLEEPRPPDPALPQIAATEPTEPGTDESVPTSADLASELLRELAALTPAPATAGAPKYGATRPPTPPTPPRPPVPVEPAPAEPKPAPVEKPTPAAEPKPAPAPPPPLLPTATWAPNRPGLVQSPFGKPGELVDVAGKPAGAKVVCPYSNKPFLVPSP